MQSACVLLCCHLWPIRLYHVFPHFRFSTFSYKRHDFQQQQQQSYWVENLRLVVSTKFVWKISHSGKNSAKCYHKCAQIFMQSACYFYQILMKIELYRYIFDKYSDFKVHENSSIRRWVVLCRQTDTWRIYWSLFAILRKRLKRNIVG